MIPKGQHRTNTVPDAGTEGMFSYFFLYHKELQFPTRVGLQLNISSYQGSLGHISYIFIINIEALQNFAASLASQAIARGNNVEFLEQEAALHQSLPTHLVRLEPSFPFTPRFKRRCWNLIGPWPVGCCDHVFWSPGGFHVALRLAGRRIRLLFLM